MCNIPKIILIMLLGAHILVACGSASNMSNENKSSKETLTDTTHENFTKETSEWYEQATYVEEETPYGKMLMTSFERKENLMFDMFLEFVPREMTEEDVMNIAGYPHALYGYGHIYMVYFTSDGYVVALGYTRSDQGSVLSDIMLLNENGAMTPVGE